jgi:hypothetical protein
MSTTNTRLEKNKIKTQKKQAITTTLGTSRIDTLKIEDARRSKVSDARSLFKDKEQLAIHLYRTKMCNSVSSGQSCRNGLECPFAHTPDQLRVPECPYGNLCDKVVQKLDGTWHNNKLRRCTARHPGETDTTLNDRTKKQLLILKRPTDIPPSSIVLEPQPIVLAPPPPPIVLAPPPPPPPQPIVLAPPVPKVTRSPRVLKPNVCNHTISWAEMMDRNDAIINVTREEVHRVLDKMLAENETDIHFHIC